MTAPQKNLLSIQYLRALAALMVVLHHARGATPWLFNPLEKYEAFAWGVDIFFVISGFVMYVAAKQERPRDFLTKRIIRVVPLYWCATLALLLIHVRLNIADVTIEEWTVVVKSLAFIPHYSLELPSEVFPYLIPGWTLNYEMLFYLIFFFGLFFGQLLSVVGVAIVGFFVLGCLVDFKNPVMSAYTSPMVLEFLTGIFLALVYEKKWLKPVSGWLLPIGFAGLLMIPLSNDEAIAMTARVIFSTLIVAGAVSLNHKMPHMGFAKLLGDASYAIYLMHMLIAVRVVAWVWQRVPIDGWVQFLSWITLALVGSSLVGVWTHLYFEKPMLYWLKKRFLKPKHLIPS